jgi:hypothetical protein
MNFKIQIDKKNFVDIRKDSSKIIFDDNQRQGESE